MSALMTVPFHGANLMLVEHEGQPYVPMKPVVEGIGLDWGGQAKRLTANNARWGISVMEIPSAGGMQQAVCLPLRKLAGWLSTVQASRVKSDGVRAKIVEYQNECDDALWQYWNDGHAENPRAVAREPINDPVIPPERQLPAAAESFDAAKRIAQGLGLEGNQAILSANRMVKGAIGVDVMQLAGVTHLVNEAQELNYTPTELGARFDMTANQMNKLLADCGLQRHAEYAKGKKRWELLPDGKPFAVIIDSSKKHSDGAPVQQIRWKESVLGELKKLAHRLQAELPKRAGGDI
ncbi:phage antirepressor N-terminal domain-containing protein [Azotobacter beijerinckii]|uniref:phage antirepressor N-terminal domain-containing protein n=1 Tax=Azotobacter beijerinckii TaxID=170623 RepID=UPI0029559258|nr:phage antirepressor N-terminal domain-containing protein [Azotobacter beijerinckii]MDV7209894.1 phage antirepressor N-terminal domain-containing protein [Azotobacter beijerinckii]